MAQTPTLLHELLDQAVLRKPSGLALTSRQQSLTYREPAAMISPLGGEPDQPADLPADLPAQPCLSVDPICLIYTSDTTSLPKAVVSTPQQVLFAATAIQRWLRYRDEDVVYCPLPLSYDYGLYQIFLSALSGAELWLGTVAESGPPLLLLRLLTNTGAALSRSSSGRPLPGTTQVISTSLAVETTSTRNGASGSASPRWTPPPTASTRCVLRPCFHHRTAGALCSRWKPQSAVRKCSSA